MTNIALILNRASGDGRFALACISYFKQHFPGCPIFDISQYSSTQDIISDAYNKHVRTMIIAGGDGTISRVVSELLIQHLDVKIGIIPIGTLNHFAKDLHIPLDITRAFEVVTQGDTHLIDVGKINNHYFINTSSLGIYPAMVKERKILEKHGWKKWFALVVTVFSVVRTYASIKVNFERADKTFSQKTSFVFIGNNKYSVSGRTIGARERLDQGILTVCIARHTNRLRLIQLAIKALLGTIEYEPDFNMIGLTSCIIRSRERELLVSYDGEVETMKSPLLYSIIPKALAVIVP